jgi:hypothetical protein
MLSVEHDLIHIVYSVFVKEKKYGIPLSGMLNDVYPREDIVVAGSICFYFLY